MRKLVTLLLLTAAAAVALAIGTAGASGPAAGVPSSKAELQGVILMPSGEFAAAEVDELPDGTVLRVATRRGRSPDGSETPPQQCRDGDDNDADGKIDFVPPPGYQADPGCSGTDDNDEWNPPPPPPPAPPPPPPLPPPPPEGWPYTMVLSNPPIWSEYGYDECEDGRPLNSKSPSAPCLAPDGTPTNIRCKVYTYTFSFNEGHFGIDVHLLAIKYKLNWKLCYRPNGGGITSVKYRNGDMVDKGRFWEWQGNEPGYPQHVRYAHSVLFKFRLRGRICILPDPGCGPSAVGQINSWFYDEGQWGRIDNDEWVL